MKPKSVIISGAFMFCLALGIFALVKLPKAVADSDGESSSPENAPTLVTVQTGAIKRATLHRYVNGYGVIEPAPATVDKPAADAQLAAPVAGVVAKINVVEGQQVKKGDVLVELNSGATTAGFAEQELARQTKLFAQQNTSLKNLQNVEAQLDLLRVVAPLAGTVTHVNVKLGQAVDLSTVVAEVMDLNRLAVNAEIPAAEAGDLKTGEEVEIGGTDFQAASGQNAPSTTVSLSFVCPTLDKNNGTILIRALLPPDSGLRPGQFVQLKIVTAVRTNCLAAPAESIVTDDSGNSVIALVKGDEAVQTRVKVGLREKDWVEIKSPEIKAGDVVVTVGTYGLPAKTKIRVENP